MSHRLGLLDPAQLTLPLAAGQPGAGPRPGAGAAGA